MESRNQPLGNASSALPDLPMDVPVESYYPVSRPAGRIRPPQAMSEDAIEMISHVLDTPTPRPADRIPTKAVSRTRGRASRNEDVVVSLRQIPAPAEVENRAERIQVPFVLPPLREMAGQTVPCAVMALTLAATALVGDISILGIPVWAFALTVPTLLLLIFSNSLMHPLWKKASVINLIAVLAVFPALVVRQSVSKIPFSDSSNGTLLAPMATTILVLVMLASVAVLSSILCREDPEYAGVVFLPAAMLVPFFAGAGDITNLRTAMLMSVAIFITAAVLTVVATVVPAHVAVAIAPAAIMVEFLLLAAVRGANVFPLGAGTASKVLFFSIVAFTVALTIIVPMLTFWLQQVMLIVRSNQKQMTGMASASR